MRRYIVERLAVGTGCGLVLIQSWWAGIALCMIAIALYLMYRNRAAACNLVYGFSLGVGTVLMFRGVSMLQSDKIIGIIFVVVGLQLLLQYAIRTWAVDGIDEIIPVRWLVFLYGEHEIRYDGEKYTVKNLKDGTVLHMKDLKPIL